MKYGLRIHLTPETLGSSSLDIVGKMVKDAFQNKLREDNVKVTRDLFVDVMISDKEKGLNAT